MNRNALQMLLESFLDCARFSDYSPNGLQVEGREEIARVVCGVTASQALIEHAVEVGADAIIVHHGWFWRGEDPCLTGFRRKRAATLMAHDINLFAYHLPLDAHPELGNNAQLGKLLGWRFERLGARQPLVHHGVLPHPLPAGELARQLAARLAREPLLVGNPERLIRRVAWCTGGAQAYFEQAILEGAELYLSGEISEQTVHLARETGVPYIAAGHHATERYGIQALGAWLAREHGLQTSFVDLDNPV
ncbi:Nif3-like dinuclear metal center hexameric protein [Uliginosibacterium paludis]|uniref:Nif3-like dinuclear metal center hexameric protein n=1 Tax=Uliginosibacterium paludis TaxID=1615952 RepID=A0ABV2CQ22_9RHOO